MSVFQRSPSYRLKYRGKERQGENSRCPFYRSVRLIEVPVKRESQLHNFIAFLIYFGVFLRFTQFALLMLVPIVLIWRKFRKTIKISLTHISILP